MLKHKKVIALLVTSALALVAAFGAFTYRSVYAQTAAPTPSTPNNQTQGAQPGSMPGRGGRGGGGPQAGYSNQDLATALGITTDQLTAAYTAANTEALKQAVSQGLITQSQADQLAANGFDSRHLGGFGIPGSSTSSIDYNAILAKALGISTDKLQAAYQTAYNTSVDTAVTNGNLTQAQADLMKGNYALENNAKFKTALQSAYEAAVKQAVTDGVITQAQADAILAQQSQNGGGFFGHGFGGDFGHGFGHPDFNGAPGNTPANPSNPAPTTVPGSGL